MTALFSVIIPTRNRPELLARAVAGVRAQTCDDVEIVVVDDGSAPDHAAAIQALGADLAVVRLETSHPRGSGPAFARNAGAARAAGRYIAFCDDDDEWIRADHLATAAAFLAGNADVDYLFANQEAVSGGRVTNPDWLPELAALGGDDWRRVSRAEVFRLGHFPHLNTTIVGRSLYERIGGMYEHLPYSSDLDFFLRAADAARAMAFRHSVVARHHEPDRGKRQNVSTALAEIDKQFVYTMIAGHLFSVGASAEAVANARRRAGWAYRQLAEAAAAEGRPAAARALADLGLAARPSWKWALYAAWLRLRR